MFVVALTSLANAAASTLAPRVGHASSTRSPTWSSTSRPRRAIRRSGSPVWKRRSRPLSSVTGCTIINLIKAEVARLLTEAGHPPKVLTSACHLGAERARELFEETYDDYRRRVGVLYR